MQTKKKSKEYIKQINDTHMHRNITPELLLLTFLPTLLSEYNSDDFHHQSNGKANTQQTPTCSQWYINIHYTICMQHILLHMCNGIVVVNIVKYKQPSIAFTCLQAQFTVEKIDINFWLVYNAPYAFFV